MSLTDEIEYQWLNSLLNKNKQETFWIGLFINNNGLFFTIKIYNNSFKYLITVSYYLNILIGFLFLSCKTLKPVFLDESFILIIFILNK